jgi:hypothetical protein
VCNSAERQRRGRNIIGIKGQVGGLKWNQPFFVGPQLNHATLAKTRIVSRIDKRERLTAQGVAGIKDRDGLAGCNTMI